ncbi:hypothetical protein AND_001294 [Anopheles darlingi]|uniref:Uncharacterized protein n=1 Tax=Anopheles darlingi TaxID=43151 RepID=W5JVP4_ANODA|nr:hypothetical protein AND_001294 [Anopheles darlingi]
MKIFGQAYITIHIRGQMRRYVTYKPLRRVACGCASIQAIIQGSGSVSSWGSSNRYR